MAIPAAQAVILSFDTYHSFEIDGTTGCWDGASMEAKVGAGAFTFLGAERFFTDSYNGTIEAGAPLAGRQADDPPGNGAGTWVVFRNERDANVRRNLEAGARKGVRQLLAIHPAHTISHGSQ